MQLQTMLAKHTRTSTGLSPPDTTSSFILFGFGSKKVKDELRAAFVAVLF